MGIPDRCSGWGCQFCINVPRKVSKHKTMQLLILTTVFAFCGFVRADGQCGGQGDGGIANEEKASGHRLHYSKAFIQEKAPYWEATAAYKGELTDVKLTDYAGKYLVMLFYPNAFTFVCPTEILAFNDRIAEFREIGAEVVAISVDSAFAALAWQNVPRSQGGVGSLSIPMVSDGLHSISKDYGVYLSNMGVSLRGLIIIDGNGIVRQITMNDLPVGRSVDETLRLVKAFQFTDKNPVVCPANWTPGQDTIIPDPTKKLEYFTKVNKNEL